ncbi:MAG: hypothetical protein K2L83_05040 [Muribaculaceae bacterium]|nr:hypothetical protein [Muribaculaceae bacterium]
MEIYLNLPRYLQEWFVFQCYGEWTSKYYRPPVCRFQRSSIESSILRMGLRAPRFGEEPMCRCPEGWTRVEVPVFKGIDLTTRNYLPEKTRIALESCLRSRFDVDLWECIKDKDFSIVPINEMLEAWMDSRGIEPNDTNFHTVSKRAQRLRERAVGRARQQRYRMAKKNASKNA